MVPLLKAGSRNFIPALPPSPSPEITDYNYHESGNCQLANKDHNNLHDTWDHFYFKLITIYTEEIK